MSNSLVNRVLATDNGAAALALRIPVGIIFVAHGAQKLFGWFGGYGFSGTMHFFTEVKKLPYPVALLVIIIEFAGPFFLLVGAATRFWALLLIADMAGIIVSSHTQFGFFMNWFGNQQGEGYEYHLLFITVSLVLLISGGGKISVDRWFTKNKSITP